jgi:hypothetical protein
MKNITVKILLIILTFGCYSCTTKKNTIPHALHTVTVLDNEMHEFHKASDIFDNITLIPLETTDESLIGSVSKVAVIDSIIYIQCNRSLSLLMYDMQGHFLNKICKIGQGPGEYTYLNDFTVLPNKDILVIDHKQLICYDRYGNYKKTYKLSFTCDAVETLNDSILIFNGSSDDDGVIVYNIKKKRVVNSHFKYDARHNGRILQPLTKYSDTVYFKRPLSSLIYKVEIDSISEYWFLDFGKRTITDDKIVKADIAGAGAIYGIHPSMADIYYFTETANFVVFSFQIEDIREGMPHYVFHSKSSSMNIITTRGLLDNDVSFYCNPPDIVDVTDSEQFIETLEPYYYRECFSKYADTGSMDEAKRKRWQYVKKTLQNVSDDDNPIVALYTLKNF